MTFFLGFFQMSYEQPQMQHGGDPSSSSGSGNGSGNMHATSTYSIGSGTIGSATGRNSPLMLAVSIALYVATVVFAIAKAPLQAIVTLIAGTAYMTMYLGLGPAASSASSGNAAQARAPRYFDWSMTTPLLLWLILKPSLPLPQMIMYMAFDVAMIYAGYASAIAPTLEERASWYGISCAFFVPVLYALVTTQSHKIPAYSTLVLWLAYPILHGMRYLSSAPDGTPAPLLNGTAYNAAISAFDLLAKVGVGALVIADGIKG